MILSTGVLLFGFVADEESSRLKRNMIPKSIFYNEFSRCNGCRFVGEATPWSLQRWCLIASLDVQFECAICMSIGSDAFLFWRFLCLRVLDSSHDTGLSSLRIVVLGSMCPGTSVRDKYTTSVRKILSLSFRTQHHRKFRQPQQHHLKKKQGAARLGHQLLDGSEPQETISDHIDRTTTSICPGRSTARRSLKLYEPVFQCCMLPSIAFC